MSTYTFHVFHMLYVWSVCVCVSLGAWYCCNGAPISSTMVSRDAVLISGAWNQSVVDAEVLASALMAARASGVGVCIPQVPAILSGGVGDSVE